MHALPPPAFHLLWRRARVIVPALVVPEDESVGTGHPRELRNGIGQRPKALFAFAHLLLRLPALGDVLYGNKAESDRPVVVVDRGAAIAGEELVICLAPTHPQDLVLNALPPSNSGKRPLIAVERSPLV